jgi:N-dimethylarginine dimethylaminohydrolase
MGKPNPQNLNPCTPENARERQLKSAEKRKENNAKKKLMSQIYAEFLEREYSVKVAEGTKKISGAELVNEAMKKIIARGDSSSVAVMREIRETLEGQKINLSGSVETKLQTTEERLKAFEDLMK